MRIKKILTLLITTSLFIQPVFVVANPTSTWKELRAASKYAFLGFLTHQTFLYAARQTLFKRPDAKSIEDIILVTRIAKSANSITENLEKHYKTSGEIQKQFIKQKYYQECFNNPTKHAHAITLHANSICKRFENFNKKTFSTRLTNLVSNRNINLQKVFETLFSNDQSKLKNLKELKKSAGNINQTAKTINTIKTNFDENKKAIIKLLGHDEAYKLEQEVNHLYHLTRALDNPSKQTELKEEFKKNHEQAVILNRRARLLLEKKIRLPQSIINWLVSDESSNTHTAESFNNRLHNRLLLIDRYTWSVQTAAWLPVMAFSKTANMPSTLLQTAFSSGNDIWNVATTLIPGSYSGIKNFGLFSPKTLKTITQAAVYLAAGVGSHIATQKGIHYIGNTRLKGCSPFLNFSANTIATTTSNKLLTYVFPKDKRDKTQQTKQRCLSSVLSAGNIGYGLYLATKNP